MAAQRARQSNPGTRHLRQQSTRDAREDGVRVPEPEVGAPQHVASPNADLPTGATASPGNDSATPVNAGQRDDETGDTDRAGVDARRRGWFWHWNNVVTQYAPLIGLKGIGLLNSYTVWTDRREESPHRGYAFPGQQSEAAFYGEERSELITINKILVTLELIEIRKEMILRADNHGRQWRVPHNLYRVRDRPEGVDLRASDVLRVTHLAHDDAAVYRYVRRIFSARFKPIDRDNVWHAILAELADHPLWQEMQERTRITEERASARSRAGHKGRAKRDDQPAKERASSAQDIQASSLTGTILTDGQSQDMMLRESEQGGVDRDSEITNVGAGNNASPRQSDPLKTVVEQCNSGSGVDVAGSNTAIRGISTPIAALGNSASETAVGDSNTTYHQSLSTTTTTTTTTGTDTDSGGSSASDDTASVASGSPEDRPIGAKSSPEHAALTGAVPSNPASAETPIPHIMTTPPPPNTASAVAQVSAGIERRPQAHETGLDVEQGAEYLDESSTRLVRTPDDRDRRDDRTTDGSAAPERRAADTARDGNSWSGPLADPDPLVVSLFEAANDRRSTPLERILLAELERDADPAACAVNATGTDWVAAALREAVSAGSAFVAPKRIREIINRWAASGSGPTPVAGHSSPAIVAAPAAVKTPMASAPVDVRLPGGARAATLWPVVLEELRQALDITAYERLLSGSNITRYWRGTVDIEVATPDAAHKLTTEYRALIARHLNARLRKPVAVAFHAAALEPVQIAAAAAVTSSTPTPCIVVSRADLELGRQVWLSILDDLAPGLTLDDLERLSGVVPLGEESPGVLLLGTRSPVARRLLEGRYQADVERALSTLLGYAVTVRVADDTAWSVSQS